MNSNSNRDDFSKPTKDMLAKRALYHCSNPNCRRPTAKAAENNDNEVIYIGAAAHIAAAAPDGPRYNPDMSEEERKSIKNGIHLCRNCADEIDKNKGVDYPVAKLKKWKSEHDLWTRKNFHLRKFYANYDVDVSNNKYYQRLQGELSDLERLHTLIPAEEKVNLISRIESKKGEIESFKGQLINTYHEITKIEVDMASQVRAQEAAAGGNIDESRRILLEDLPNIERLESELIGKKRRIEEDIAEINKASGDIANHYLLLAFTITIDLADPDRLEKTKTYFEQSIAALERQDNLLEYGKFLQYHNQIPEAIEQYKKVLGFPEPVSLVKKAAACSNLGVIYKNAGDLVQAKTLIKESIRIAKNLVEQEFHENRLADLSSGLNNLGTLYMRRAQSGSLKRYLKAAMKIHEMSLSIRKNLVSSYNNRYLLDVSVSLVNIATCLHMLGKRDESLTIFEESLEIQENLKREHPNGLHKEYPMILGAIGNLHEEMNRNDKALNYYNRSLHLYKSMHHIDRQNEFESIGQIHFFLGRVYNKIADRDNFISNSIKAIFFLQEAKYLTNQGCTMLEESFSTLNIAGLSSTQITERLNQFKDELIQKQKVVNIFIYSEQPGLAEEIEKLYNQ